MDRLQETIAKIKKLDSSLMKQVQARLDSLTKPRGSLGKLEELAKQIVSITANLNPRIEKKAIIVMTADHGVVEEGISAYPREVTPQMVYNFLNGGAAINVLARHIGAEVLIVDVGVAADFQEHQSLMLEKIDYGTKNMVKGPAMTDEQAVKSLEVGIEAAEKLIKKGYDIIATGDMGIGNTTASSAIAAVICRTDVEFVTGYGTGIDDRCLENKINVIKKAISVNKPDAADGIDVLSKVGGFEIGGIAGIILGCASGRTPVVIDGFISGAGALISAAISPDSANYMIASHCSAEKGHRIVLDRLGLKPLFYFDMRLGEGTGAAIGINIVEASVKILSEMATFSQAGISEKNE
ncbi:MAG: nicotinate-nucleotide--dimethylbenzimidazole phosphoribosyltransferase [Candidatus Hydromicrobium americanum]|nr:MAG: nicotinate-nucleotide--dimethylbenzimidazole phosphoribosyltransferase [Candidatus Hydromicrobium americanum]